MRRANGNGKAQMPLFAAVKSPTLDAIQGMDVTQLTPIEALTKLYELQRMAKDET
jgi:DNA mismatch repair protein MutS